MDIIVILKPFFDWRALIDIFLMTAGLFFLYRTLQRLGTWSIAAGILIATGVYLLAVVLDLKGIEWILGNLSQVAVVALIVIFQPELRKIFERTASIRRSKKVGSDENLATLLVESVWKLADKREGAIIVLPGKDPVQEWLQGGYSMGAIPSLPLIMSIFDHNSPGHDGALIVSQGKLARFGVRLPISQSARLSDEYGTRHHAGMGLSEKSDALTIVVSEERGKVSIFQNGKMQAIADQRTLAAAITKHWRNTASLTLDLPEETNRRLVFAQLAASLVVALFFWSTLIIAQGETLEKVITVPVEFTPAPAHLALVGEKDKHVRLHLSGPKSDLVGMNPDDLSVKIDLSKTNAGKQVFIITSDNMRLPRSVSLLDVVPSSVELTLAEIVEQEVAIKPQLVGKLPGTLKIRSLEVSPAKIKVLAPLAGRQNRPISVITTPIYLESIKSDTSIYCKIIAPPTVQPVAKSWPDAEVIIKVGQ